MNRRRLPVAAVALAAILAGAAWAADGHDLVQRLDSDDAAARTAALTELRAAAERDSIIVRSLRDEKERGSLGPRALETLVELAGELDLRFANGGLRAIVADPAAPLPVRKKAALTLAKTGSAADVSALGDAVHDLPDEAAHALVAIGGTAATNALRRGGGETPPLEVHAGLALLGDASGLPHLVEALQGPDAARAGALLKWATGRDLPPEPAAWQSHLRCREIAARFADLDNDKAGDAADELAAKLRSADAGRLADDVVAILKDTSFPAPVRDKAALTLGLGGVRSAKDALLWACRDGEVGSVRMYAASALARVGDLSCAPVLVAMLNNDEDKDRIAARRTGEGDFFPVDPTFVRALYRLGCRGACDRVIELLAGEFRTRLHRDCLRALEEFSGGDDFGFEPDASKAERQAAVLRIRAWWREARETIDLAPKPDDPGWAEFRKVVDENVEKLGGFKFLYQLRAKNLLIDLAEPARPQIEAALANENLHIRMGAADVLAAAALRDSANALAARLAVESKPEARTRILVALEICGRPRAGGAPAGGPEVVQAVRAALDDRSIDVRIAAARTLGVVGDVAADTPRLLAARAEKRNEDPAFRFTVSASILRLAFRASIADILTQLRSDDDVALRTEAMKALVAGGIDLHGYDPDAPKEAREAAIRQIVETVPSAFSTVPYKERK